MGETFRLALDSLRAHKLRSFLTLLGVILAVTTLVAVMSVVAGLNFYVADRIANLGANVFVVDRFGIITSEDAWVKAQKRPLLTMEEFNRLRETMRTANAIAAIEGTTMDVRSGNQLLENTNVLGVTPNYPEVRNMNLAAGRMISGADETHRSPVCYIGADVAKKFFFNVDPIGKTIRVGAHSYEVIGVAAAIGSAFGQSQDNYMLIPLGTFYKEWHTQRDSMTLFIQARNTEMMAASEDEARMFLRAARHLPWEAEDNFGILGSDSIMSLWKEITGNLEAVVVGLTSIFLEEVAGSQEETHRIAIHNRVSNACRARRNNGLRTCLCGSCRRAGANANPCADPTERSHHCAGSFDWSWPILWDLSGDAGSETRSHRSSAVRRLRNSNGTTAWRKPEAGDGHPAGAQDAQRADGIRRGAGRERDHARGGADHRL